MLKQKTLKGSFFFKWKRPSHRSKLDGDIQSCTGQPRV